MRYARDVPRRSAPDVILATEQHIRTHLSAIATEDDNPDTLADEVAIGYRVVGNQVRITGEFDAEPVAAYLRDDFDPEQDIEANPLSVPSIEDER